MSESFIVKPNMMQRYSNRAARTGTAGRHDSTIVFQQSLQRGHINRLIFI